MSLMEFKKRYTLIVIALCLILVMIFLSNFKSPYVEVASCLTLIIVPLKFWITRKYWICPKCGHTLPIDYKGDPDFSASRNGCEFCGSDVYK